MTFAKQVAEFNENILKIEPREIGFLSQAEVDISMQCLLEESSEFLEAHKGGDIIGCIDAIVDLQYFAMGMLYKMGIPAAKIDAICTAVHNANMTKVRGSHAKRGDGEVADAVKPADWISPEERIAEILDNN